MYHSDLHTRCNVSTKQITTIYVFSHLQKNDKKIYVSPSNHAAHAHIHMHAGTFT